MQWSLNMHTVAFLELAIVKDGHTLVYSKHTFLIMMVLLISENVVYLTDFVHQCSTGCSCKFKGSIFRKTNSLICQIKKNWLRKKTKQKEKQVLLELFTNAAATQLQKNKSNQIKKYIKSSNCWATVLVIQKVNSAHGLWEWTSHFPITLEARL